MPFIHSLIHLLWRYGTKIPGNKDTALHEGDVGSLLLHTRPFGTKIPTTPVAGRFLAISLSFLHPKDFSLFEVDLKIGRKDSSARRDRKVIIFNGLFHSCLA